MQNSSIVKADNVKLFDDVELVEELGVDDRVDK